MKEFIERRIIIGLITSTEFIQNIRNDWDVKLLESQMAKRLATWCIDYFDQYGKAPSKNIEGIYYQKLKEGLPDVISEEIEEDILPGLSEEYERETFNLDYLLDQARLYLKEKRLLRFSKEIQGAVDEGDLTEAERIAAEFKPNANGVGACLDLSNKEAVEKSIDKAFDETFQSIIRYPKQVGEFLNAQLVRGGFVSLMGTEKRGKTFWLLDMAIRAHRQKAKVAFFQAGDMTETQQMKRLCSLLTKKSTNKKYIGPMLESVADCVRNQINSCD